MEYYSNKICSGDFDHIVLKAINELNQEDLAYRQK